MKKADGVAPFDGTDGKTNNMAEANATAGATEKQSRNDFIRTDV